MKVEFSFPKGRDTKILAFADVTVGEGCYRPRIPSGRRRERSVRGRSFEAGEGQRRTEILETGHVREPRDQRSLARRPSRELQAVERG